MKKFPFWFLIFIMSFQLMGCSNSEETSIPDENTFIINFINKSEIEFQGVEVSYFQNDILRGTANIENASEKEKVKNGDSIPLEFNMNNFNLDEEAKFDVTIITDKRTEEKITISTPISTKLSTLKSTYYIEISGESKESLTLN
ncbi:hypothetical protein [Sutcliffiella deserti]|uniref:hypothetical protein n=1 Tax=Sutcliffiella deserti TaxID=2875501 RepID=UPI001CBE16CA|nr:hypothetical protein [Sutcliffiella deserti]